MATRIDIVTEARRWIGTPFAHGQWVLGAGCDCVGLVRGVGRATGLLDAPDSHPDVQPFLGYGREPKPGQMRAALERFLVKRDLPAEPGDVLWLMDAEEPRHLAIVTAGVSGASGIIHATSRIRTKALPGGGVYEHRLDALMAAKIIAAYSYPGIAS
jgi:cell wall-associated NlpC family hydrolase